MLYFYYAKVTAKKGTIKRCFEFEGVAEVEKRIETAAEYHEMRENINRAIANETVKRWPGLFSYFECVYEGVMNVIIQSINPL